MKIELIKEQKPLGEIDFWVLVNDSYLSSLSKVFRNQEAAESYFKGLERTAKELGTETQSTILKSVTL